MRINYLECIQILSNTLVMLNPELVGHQKRVAYISSKIATQMKLDKKIIMQTLIASLLHDIGSLNRNEIPEMLKFESLEILNHQIIGFELLKDIPWLSEIANIVLFHHTAYNEADKNPDLKSEVPIESYIICLADRIDVLIGKGEHVLTQAEGVREKIRLNLENNFHPMCVEAFLQASKSEAFWLDLLELPISLGENNAIMHKELRLIELKDIAMVCANIIDFRSPFTATHSIGVASVAKKIKKIMGGSDFECHEIEIAGLFHDLGKLVIPLEILEKPDLLTHEEFKIMKSHTYYTYLAMNISEGLYEIKKWSSYHHEKLDGTGYPFRKTKDEIPMEAQIIAVSDVFTALTENRPYRGGMDLYQVKKILREMVENHSLCLEVVEVVFENSSEILDICIKAQQKYRGKYESLSSLIS